MDTKKVLVLTGAALAIYFVVSNPTGAADFVQSILNWLKEAGEAILKFVSSVFNGIIKG